MPRIRFLPAILFVLALHAPPIPARDTADRVRPRLLGSAPPAAPVRDLDGRDTDLRHVHPDYRVRVPAAVILAAAREIAAGRPLLR